MSEHGKITASHRPRTAAIYVRQSALAQLERDDLRRPRDEPVLRVGSTR
jgi:hypothetical protein